MSEKRSKIYLSSNVKMNKRRSIVIHHELALDGAKKKKHNIINLFFGTIFQDVKFILGSMIYIGVWSSVCAYFTHFLESAAQNNPDGKYAYCLEYIEAGKDPLRYLGALFSFSLIFRFKVCYDRWWEGRQLFADSISACLDLAMQANRWIKNDDIASCFTRLLVVYMYACKNLLRDSSLCESGDGNDLLKREILIEAELLEIQGHGCWEPHFCLEAMRELLQRAFLIKDGFYLEATKIHGQVYRCFDNSIKDLNDRIGKCIGVKSADLPVAYDGVHLLGFYVYFTLAPLIWAAESMWVTIPVSVIAGFIALSLISLGTQLIDPFGDDKVDIPMEAFCKTIEEQIAAIAERRERGEFKKLFAFGNPV